MPAGDLPWQALRQLDAGAWHSSAYAGERLPLLSELAAFCIQHGHALNIEIKPTPGLERRTGECVAALAATLWQDQTVPPLLTSFQIESLQAAQATAPQLPRGLLIDAWRDDVFGITQTLGCVALVCNFKLWTAERVQLAHQHGLKALSYTVNQPQDMAHMLALATDGIITDEIKKPIF